MLKRRIEIGQRGHLSEGDIEAVKMLDPDAPALPPKPTSQPRVITTTTTIAAGDRTTTTTKTAPCHSSGIVVKRPYPRCCHDRWGAGRFCRSNVCPTVRISWPRPDIWCRPGWRRPRPRPPLCGGWIEDGWEPPPFDDWD
jgi:hypothetical protein